MGRLLRGMVKDYSGKPSATWTKILNTKPILTSKEAEDIKNIISRVRHEYGFRK